MRASTLLSVLRETWHEWSEDKAARLGAALAYYTAFSLAPLLIIAIAIAGLAFGEEAARGMVHRQIEGLSGPEGARAIEILLEGARKESEGRAALAIGFGLLLFGASGVFGQLQDSLNTIWEVAPRPGRPVWRIVRDRFLSFTLVLGTGFLLLVSLLVSAALAAFRDWLGPGEAWEALHMLGSFAVITGLFAVIFRFLPDAVIQWRDVVLGAAVTAALFLAGKFALGWYLGRGAFTSTYGAAGSILVVLLWVYYASQIFFLGAEFTQVWANRFGSRVVPKPGAVAVTRAMRAEQGIPRRDRERGGS